ncbi:hypothetical protein CYMTET_4833 [Cymbomonas tetramitiformis]|uniref:Uncharacterized protein n=1 Tax=Cymbomonas tetramitiformis TaxID=36881 RepID=A0AAE0H0F4_9CHLO|nr:hypothetical protein CYMTET_4833 [Cymbomonas tetramitiformis]
MIAIAFHDTTSPQSLLVTPSRLASTRIVACRVQLASASALKLISAVTKSLSRVSAVLGLGTLFLVDNVAPSLADTAKSSQDVSYEVGLDSAAIESMQDVLDDDLQQLEAALIQNDAELARDLEAVLTALEEVKRTAANAPGSDDTIINFENKLTQENLDDFGRSLGLLASFGFLGSAYAQWSALYQPKTRVEPPEPQPKTGGKTPEDIRKTQIQKEPDIRSLRRQIQDVEEALHDEGKASLDAQERVREMMANLGMDSEAQSKLLKGLVSQGMTTEELKAAQAQCQKLEADLITQTELKESYNQQQWELRFVVQQMKEEKEETASKMKAEAERVRQELMAKQAVAAKAASAAEELLLQEKQKSAALEQKLFEVQQNATATEQTLRGLVEKESQATAAVWRKLKQASSELAANECRRQELDAMLAAKRAKLATQEEKLQAFSELQAGQEEKLQAYNRLQGVHANVVDERLQAQQLAAKADAANAALWEKLKEAASEKAEVSSAASDLQAQLDARHSQLAQLEDKLQTTEDLQAATEGERDVAQGLVAKGDLASAQLWGKLHLVTNDLAASRRINAEFENSQAAKERQLAAAECRAAELEVKSSAQESKLVKTEQELKMVHVLQAQTAMQRELAEGLAAKADATSGHLWEKLKKVTNELVESESQRTEISAQLTAQRCSVAALEEKLKDYNNLQAEKLTAQQLAAKADAATAAVWEKLKTATSEASKSPEAISALQAKLAARSTEKAHVEKQLQTTAEMQAAAEADRDVALGLVAKGEAAGAHLWAKLRVATSELADTEHRSAELEAKHDAQQMELVQTRQKLEASQALQGETAAQKEIAEGLAATAEASSAKLWSKLKESTDELAARSPEAVRVLQTELSAERNALSITQEELAQSEQALEATTAEKEVMEGLVAKGDASTAILWQKLRTATDDLEENTDHIAELDAQLAAQKSLVAALEEEMKNYEMLQVVHAETVVEKQTAHQMAAKADAATSAVWAKLKKVTSETASMSPELVSNLTAELATQKLELAKTEEDLCSMRAKQEHTSAELHHMRAKQEETSAAQELAQGLVEKGVASEAVLWEKLKTATNDLALMEQRSAELQVMHDVKESKLHRVQEALEASQALQGETAAQKEIAEGLAATAEASSAKLWSKLKESTDELAARSPEAVRVLQTELSAERNALSITQEELAQSEQALEATTAEKEVMEGLVAKGDASTAILWQKLRTATDDLEENTDHIAELDAQLAAQKSLVAALEEEMKNYEMLQVVTSETASMSPELVSNLTAELATQKLELAKTEEDLCSMRAKQEHTSAELHHMRAKQEETSAAQELAQGLVEKGVASEAVLWEKLKTATNDLALMEQRSAELQVMHDVKESKLHRVQEALEASQALQGETAAQKEIAEGLAATAEASSAKLWSKLKESTDELAARSPEAVRVLQTELSAERNALSITQEELAQSEQALEATTAEKEVMEGLVAKGDASTAILWQKLRTATDDLEENTDHIAELDAQLAAQKSLVAALEEEMKNYEMLQVVTSETASMSPELVSNLTAELATQKLELAKTEEDLCSMRAKQEHTSAELHHMRAKQEETSAAQELAQGLVEKGVASEAVLWEKLKTATNDLALMEQRSAELQVMHDVKESKLHRVQEALEASQALQGETAAQKEIAEGLAATAEASSAKLWSKLKEARTHAQTSDRLARTELSAERNALSITQEELAQSEQALEATTAEKEVVEGLVAKGDASTAILWQKLRTATDDLEENADHIAELDAQLAAQKSLVAALEEEMKNYEMLQVVTSEMASMSPELVSNLTAELAIQKLELAKTEEDLCSMRAKQEHTSAELHHMRAKQEETSAAQELAQGLVEKGGASEAVLWEKLKTATNDLALMEQRSAELQVMHDVKESKLHRVQEALEASQALQGETAAQKEIAEGLAATAEASSAKLWSKLKESTDELAARSPEAVRVLQTELSAERNALSITQEELAQSEQALEATTAEKEVVEGLVAKGDASTAILWQKLRTATDDLEENTDHIAELDAQLAAQKSLVAALEEEMKNYEMLQVVHAETVVEKQTAHQMAAKADAATSAVWAKLKKATDKIGTMSPDLHALEAKVAAQKMALEQTKNGLLLAQELQEAMAAERDIAQGLVAKGDAANSVLWKKLKAAMNNLGDLEQLVEGLRMKNAARESDLAKTKEELQRYQMLHAETESEKNIAQGMAAKSDAATAQLWSKLKLASTQLEAQPKLELEFERRALAQQEDRMRSYLDLVMKSKSRVAELDRSLGMAKLQLEGLMESRDSRSTRGGSRVSLK